MQKAKPNKSYDYAYEQYNRLLEKFKSRPDIRQKIILIRRLANLLMVMEFLAKLQ